MNGGQIAAFFAGTLVLCHAGGGGGVPDWGNHELERALRPYRKAGFPPLWPQLPAGDLLPAWDCADCSERLEPRAGNQVGGNIL